LSSFIDYDSVLPPEFSLSIINIAIALAPPFYYPPLAVFQAIAISGCFQLALSGDGLSFSLPSLPSRRLSLFVIDYFDDIDIHAFTLFCH